MSVCSTHLWEDPDPEQDPDPYLWLTDTDADPEGPKHMDFMDPDPEHCFIKWYGSADQEIYRTTRYGSGTMLGIVIS